MKEYLKKISLVLATCTFLFSCDKFLEENPKDKLPEDDVYNSISEVYLNAVASLYTYVGGYSDSQGLQGTGRGVYDLNTFTTDEAIIPTRGGDWYDGGFWQGLFLHDWGIENDAIQATWEYLYKVVMLSNKSLESTNSQKPILMRNSRLIERKCVLCVRCTTIICWICLAVCLWCSLLLLR